MSGPWYEEQGPTTDEVRKKLISEYLMPKKAYKFVKLETIKKLIDEVIAIEEKEYGGWGSYRGYCTFTHHKLVKTVNKKVQAVMEINARNKINQFIMNSPWTQHILYRPPTENKPVGRMYHVVQNEFTSLCNENTPKQSHLEI